MIRNLQALLSHQLSYSITHRYNWLMVPLITLAITAVVQALANWGIFPSIILPFLAFTVACFLYGNWIGNVIGALIILVFVNENSANVSRNIQVYIAIVGMALFAKWFKGWLREQILELEYLRQKEIDTYNGNRAKAVEALDALDKALNSADEVDVRKYVQIARIKLADTITLIVSWREMARDKEEAIKKLEQAKKDHEMKSYIEAIRKAGDDAEEVGGRGIKKSP